MAAHSVPFTEELYQKRLKAGRGKGEGADYKPWVTRDEILSEGTRFLAHCGRFGREMHLFSTTEHKGFLCYDAFSWVTQVLEQVPLDRSETLEIAAETGIPHPIDQDTREYVVMTTDLVIDGLDRYGRPVGLARSCKPADKLDVFNNIEHAEIERRYWQRRNRHWAFFTDSSISDLVYANLELMKPNRFLHTEEEPYEGCLDEACSLVLEAVFAARKPQRLADFAKTVQPHINGRYSAAQVLLFLIYRGQLRADISSAPFLDQDVMAVAKASAQQVEPRRRFA
jgi:hypothetical protein